MKRKLIVFLFPILYLLFACSEPALDSADFGNFRSFTPRDSSYEISYPQKWDAHRGRRSFQLMLISPKADSSDKFQENVIIFREDEEGMKLDKFVDYIINEKLPNSLKDFKIISKSEKKINNEKAYRIEYGFSYNVPAKSIGYIFEQDGFAYVVLGTALDSTFAEYSKIFDNIASTFRFIKK